MNQLLQDTTASLVVLHSVSERYLDDAMSQESIEEYLNNVSDSEFERLTAIKELLSLKEQYEEMEAGLKLREEKIKASRKEYQRRVEAIKSAIQSSMESLGEKKILNPALGIDLARTKAGGLPPLQYAPGITPDDIDPRFTRIKREFDNAAIRIALSKEEPLDWVTLGDRGEYLRIG